MCSSNLFRLLFTEQTCSVSEITQQSSLLLDMNGHPVMVGEEDVIRQANCFPFLFEVKAHTSEQSEFLRVLSCD